MGDFKTNPYLTLHNEQTSLTIVQESNTPDVMATLTTVTTVQDNKEQDTGTTVKLLLKKNRKKIQWTEDTVDNEGLGKKKSKCCCQFRKARTELEDSSSEEEEGCDTCPGH